MEREEAVGEGVDSLEKEEGKEEDEDENEDEDEDEEEGREGWEEE